MDDFYQHPAHDDSGSEGGNMPPSPDEVADEDFQYGETNHGEDVPAITATVFGQSTEAAMADYVGGFAPMNYRQTVRLPPQQHVVAQPSPSRYSGSDISPFEVPSSVTSSSIHPDQSPHDGYSISTRGSSAKHPRGPRTAKRTAKASAAPPPIHQYASMDIDDANDDAAAQMHVSSSAQGNRFQMNIARMTARNVPRDLNQPFAVAAAPPSPDHFQPPPQQHRQPPSQVMGPPAPRQPQQQHRAPSENNSDRGSHRSSRGNGRRGNERRPQQQQQGHTPAFDEENENAVFNAITRINPLPNRHRVRDLAPDGLSRADTDGIIKSLIGIWLDYYKIHYNRPEGPPPEFQFSLDSLPNSDRMVPPIHPINEIPGSDIQLHAASRYLNRAIIPSALDLARDNGAQAMDQVNQLMEAMVALQADPNAQQRHVFITPDRIDAYCKKILNELAEKGNALNFRATRLTDAQVNYANMMHAEVHFWIDRYCTMVKTSLELRMFNRGAAYNTMTSITTLTHDTFKDNPRIQFVQFICNLIRAKNLRRGPNQNLFYREVMAPNADGTGFQRTHYWDAHVEIEKWLHEISDIRTRQESALTIYPMLWDDLSGFDRLVRFIKRCGEGDIPIVDPKRSVYAFKNGIYDISKNKFYRYNTATYYNDIKPTDCTYVYFPSDAPIDGRFDEYGDCIWENISEPFNIDGSINLNGQRPDKHWANISVPFLDNWTKAQNWSHEIVSWLLFMMARTLVPQKTDMFAAALFLLGSPGVGKSFMLLTLLFAFPRQFIFNVPPITDSRTNFLFQDCIDDMGRMTKHVMACFEVDKDFNVSANTMHSQISAEFVTTEVKSKSSRTVESWNAQWLAAGNHFFAFHLSKIYATSRRWVILEVNKRPSGNVSDADILALYGSYMIKFGLAYHQRLQSFKAMKAADNPLGTDPWIWHHLPEYFNKLKSRVLVDTDLCLAMITDGGWIIYTNNPNHKLSVSSLRHGAVAFAETRNVSAAGTKIKMPTDELVRDTFRVSQPDSEFVDDDQLGFMCPVTQKHVRTSYVKGWQFSEEALPAVRRKISPQSGVSHSGGNDDNTGATVPSFSMDTDDSTATNVQPHAGSATSGNRRRPQTARQQQTAQNAMQAYLMPMDEVERRAEEQLRLQPVPQPPPMTLGNMEVDDEEEMRRWMD